MLGGPTSCRRSFKQGAKHKSIVYFVFVYILQTVEMASTLISPMVDYYNDEEELDSVDDDDDRSFRGRDSEEGNVEVIRRNLAARRARCTCWKRNGNSRLLQKCSCLRFKENIFSELCCS